MSCPLEGLPAGQAVQGRTQLLCADGSTPLRNGAKEQVCNQGGSSFSSVWLGHHTPRILTMCLSQLRLVEQITTDWVV